MNPNPQSFRQRYTRFTVFCILFILFFLVAGTRSADAKTTRLAGKTRYETSFAIADNLYQQKGKFSNMTVASGANYPDALSGCYLTYVRKTPLLLVDKSVESQVLSRIRRYTKTGGTVYLIGGTGSVSASFEKRVKRAGYKTVRLSGSNRFDTNLAILKNVGTRGKELLVASGLNYPDSLSASAVPKPLLLVGNSLTARQKFFLRSAGITRIYILGGTGSVSSTVERQLRSYCSRIERVGGANRYETSVLIAKRFFKSPATLTLASGANFPDGLSGGPVAMSRKAPLILVTDGTAASALRYALDYGIDRAFVFGGTGSVSERTVKRVMYPGPSARRNWAGVMNLPTARQIRSAAGSSRSPYVVYDHHYPNLTRAVEFCIDVRIDHDPVGTYICPFNWYYDVSELGQRYARVYNDYTGTPGGYCGFQVWDDGTHAFIMTVWSSFCQDHSGNVTVHTPRVTYPEGQGKQNQSDAEGSFTQCLRPYNWEIGKDYRILIQQSTSASTGNTTMQCWICDLSSGSWTKFAEFDTGVTGICMRSMGGFWENYITQYAGEVRTAEFFNLRARSADTGRWIAADYVDFRINASISQLDYAGSCNFGTDGKSVWAITSGVSGLCPAPSTSSHYYLSPGDTSEPY